MLKTIKLITLTMLFVVACDNKSTPALDFMIPTEDGQIPISKYRGEVVYLDFWATWCGPCRESFPWMREMQTKYKEKGLNVVAVSLDTDHALAHQFADELSANFTIAFDDTGSIADLFKVKGMPTSVLIGRDGKVVEVHQGFNEGQIASYEESIVKALE